MWLILYFVLWILNIVCVLNNRNSKLLSIVSYLCLGILFVFNSATSGDAYKYRIDFENFAFSVSWSEMGYNLLKNMVRGLGISSYNGLLFAIFILCSVFWILGIKYFTNSYNVILAVIMPFIFPTCAVVIRFFIALGIMIFSLRFLMNRQTKLYVLCVFFATLFHRTALFYLIFLVCTTNKIKGVNQIKNLGIKLFVFISGITVFLTYILGKIPFIDAAKFLISLLFKNINIKIEAYTSGITRFGAVMFFGIYIVGLVFARYMRKYIKKEIFTNDSLKSQFIEIANVNYYMQLILSITLPFIVVNLVYYRLLMVGSISNAILYGICICNKRNTRNFMTFRVDRCKLLFLALCFLWLIPEIVGLHSITIQGLINASYVLK